MERGYCCKISRFSSPTSENSLYIRPNKIYQLGSDKSSAIQLDDANGVVCTFTCDKEANVVMDVNPNTTETIKINNKVVPNKNRLNHLDVISVGGGRLQFFSFFNNGKVKMNIGVLHRFLIFKYPHFKEELNTIEAHTQNMREYRKALKSLFDALDKKDKDRVNKFREVLRTVLTIIMDDNPPGKLQLECLKCGFDTRYNIQKTPSMPKSAVVSVNTLGTPLDTNLELPTTEKKSVTSESSAAPTRNSIAFNFFEQKDKSMMVDTNASVLLNFDNIDDGDEYEEFKNKTQLPKMPKDIN
ncbi:hypothetical protein EIN_162210 [Entamoeba invadens IP1]|uniref:FHA domain-containing protein n=1 Tax=Entamoeba invadens IP1 TaxID=370355 RepID=A0A0A1U1U3_ENTIV|nr:hypothetical protein EIN_162210 [Entamoeba invadens IP1]ELP86587.1 hypothetical protein EIN_162210 [Entamoeba invadens IP1]|eukprot:XP_004185933.1 hypothetical protein EIN_162210 [Entamoeba invadens IP1]